MRINSYACIALHLLLAKTLAAGNDIASEDPARVFSGIYKTRNWGPEGEGSGPGSTVHATVRIRSIIHDFVKRNNVSTFADVPCGSFHWMRYVMEREARLEYQGFDVAVDVVNALQAEFHVDTEASRHISFTVREFSRQLRIRIRACIYGTHICMHAQAVDFTKDALPTGLDVIFSRDALQHLAPRQALPSVHRTYV